MFTIPLPFPCFFPDVGFKVGGDTRITYFVLQIHYGDVKNFRGKFIVPNNSLELRQHTYAE